MWFGPSIRNIPDARLRALYTEEWNWRKRELARGDREGPEDATDHFPKVDAASQQARLDYWTRTLATLDSIPFDQLSPEEKVNAQVFGTSIRALANDIKFKTDTYRAYLRRLRDVPRYFDEQITNMRAGLARGYTVPRVSVVGRDKTIEPYVQGDANNPLFAAFTQMPSTIPATNQTAIRTEATTVGSQGMARAGGSTRSGWAR